MWPDRRLLELFKTEFPIILAPMAGVTVPEEVPDEAAAAADPDPDAATGATGFDPESGAAATDPELAATARPVSVSRFRRCRSARMSAACW